MSHMGGSGRRRGLAVLALVLTLCVAAPELGGIATAATPAPGSSASKPTNVVLVARKTRSQVERAHFRAYLRRHPNILKRKFAKHPRLLAARLRAKAGKKKRGAYFGAKARKHKKNKKKAAAKKKRRRRAGAAAGAAAVGKKAKKHKGKSSKNSGKSLGWTDWLAIGLLALAPFAAVALLLYITDLRRRPRAPSRSKRRRSLVITPLNKG